MEKKNDKQLSILKAKAKGNWAEILETIAEDELSEAIFHAPNHVSCPIHGGKNGFRLFNDFNETGGGVCNTCGAFRDGLSLLSWAKNQSIEESITQVSELLAKGLPTTGKKSYVPVSRIEPVKEKAKIDKIWKESLPIKEGSPAWKYLRDRGLSLAFIPGSLRWHKNLAYWQDGQKIGSFPAMIGAIRDFEGKIVSLHRTYLTPDGKKVKVEGRDDLDAKKVMTPWTTMPGSAIKIWKAAPILGVAEGIETALAAHNATGMPVWSCVSAILLKKVQIPENVATVVIWVDLDRSGTGLDAANELKSRLESEGKKVFLEVPNYVLSPTLKGIDWLDVLDLEGIDGFPAKWKNQKYTFGSDA